MLENTLNYLDQIKFAYKISSITATNPKSFNSSLAHRLGKRDPYPSCHFNFNVTATSTLTFQRGTGFQLE